MRRIWQPGFLFLIGLSMMGATVARAQTDVALSLYGAFSGRTNGNGTIESPANSAGGIVELRHISNPLVGYEATYSYNRGNETYKPDCSGSTCTALTAQTVKAAAHEVTAHRLVSVHAANLRPFVLGGAGLLFHQPSTDQPTRTAQSKVCSCMAPALTGGCCHTSGCASSIAAIFTRRPT